MVENWEFVYAGSVALHGTIITCISEDHVLGRIYVRARGYPPSIFRYAQIVDLDVTESHRRRGIGGELTRLAIAWAKEEGFERVVVEASAKEPQVAVAFYGSLGFHPRSVVLDIEI